MVLFELARRGEWGKARELYEWFLPLLRLDTAPKFVQLIKLVQQEVGMGSARVRPPRLELEGACRFRLALGWPLGTTAPVRLRRSAGTVTARNSLGQAALRLSPEPDSWTTAPQSQRGGVTDTAAWRWRL